MRRWGFLEEPGETELRAALAAVGPLVTVGADATVGEALEALRTAPGGVAPAVLPRAARPYGVAEAEVLGSVSREVLEVALANGDAKGDDPVRPLLGPALPTFGVGQPAAEARAALLADGQPGVVVLVDGKAAGVLTRAALIR
jgi:cystathionine beta-synthase